VAAPDDSLGDGCPAHFSHFSNAADYVAVDTAGNVYISDSVGGRIRKISAATGLISTVAGNGGYGYSGDGGPATSAQIGDPFGIAVDAVGNLYFAEFNSIANQVIRRVDANTGIITTVAGGALVSTCTPQTDCGNCPERTDSAGDGCPATSAHLAVLGYVKVDPTGSFYFNDAARVRKVNISTGIISTVAGTGTYGFSGDGGPATEAELNAPQGLAFDAANNLYIADAGNYRIRKMSADTGVITTYAGTGSETGILPAGLASDAAGNLYIADAYLNHVIEKVSAATGALSVVAGNGGEGYSGDGGPATSAQIGTPQDVAVDSVGNIVTLSSGEEALPDVVRWISVNPSQLNFPLTLLNRSSAPQTISLANIGNDSLDLSDFTVSGAFSTDSGTTTCSTLSPIPSGGSCAVGVRFTPRVPSVLYGTLLFTDNDLNVPGTWQAVYLTGNGRPFHIILPFVRP
jgi:sugar lactone lactonase YvrE